MLLLCNENNKKTLVHHKYEIRLKCVEVVSDIYQAYNVAVPGEIKGLKVDYSLYIVGFPYTGSMFIPTDIALSEEEIINYISNKLNIGRLQDL